MKLKAAVILLKENLISTSDEWYHTFRAAPLITALFLFFIGSGTVAAQDATASVDSGKIQVFFRKGYSTFDPSYKNNGTRIRNFIEQIEQWRNRNSLHTDFLKIHGAASPEGDRKCNERLSRKRALHLRNYITAHSSLPDSVFTITGIGVNWKGLRSMAEASRMPYKKEILAILNDTLPDGTFPTNTNLRLQAVAGGKAWQYMYRHFFPALRSTSFYMEYVTHLPTPVVAADQADTTGTETDTLSTEVPGTDESIQPDGTTARDDGHVFLHGTPTDNQTNMQDALSSPKRFALKTNLLYDALLMPNIELEWLINPRWSISLDADMAWWKNDPKHKYYQMLILSPECRYWFKTFKPWHGHYAGLMAGGCLYDLENRKTGYQGEGGFVGITYGFMWPIARNFSFDTEIGVGYLYSRFEEYKPQDGHYIYQRTRDLHYAGPLKLKFSFVWRFGNISPKQKGGIK